MKPTDARACFPPAAAVADDEFERLRETFRSRLRKDQGQLTTLAASLARRERDPGGVFDALQALAHRIRGTAAIFGEAALSADAYALEEAATQASATGSDPAAVAVRSTLEALLERLALDWGIDRPETAQSGPAQA
jgi:HPt (histidine-containing phosphotransfer) domain-containing protein